VSPGSDAAAHDGVIRLLPDDVIDRIAAGEVIERPASVVKELVENAVDAGAGNVEVHLEGGGLDRIVVSDDGRGMTRADVGRAILRHATSKLTTADDLFRVRTLGFRGEALSSIAAVSRLTLSTRRPEDPVGTRLVVEGGAVLAVEDAGLPSGTTIEVAQLLYNTPARRKFMRSPATEQAHACEAALRVALGARRGAFAVHAGDRRLVDVPDDAAGPARVAAALGARVGTMFPVELSTEALRVTGFITRPEVDRADAKGLWFFVNGRYVRDRMLQRAVLDGYRSMLERGRYPVAVVYVDVDPAVVDVNVHPQKLEVRFSDGSRVYQGVARALSSVLARTPWVGEGGVRRAPGEVGARLYEAPRADGTDWPQVLREAGALAGAESLAGVAAGGGAPALVGSDGLLAARSGWFSRLRPVGQVLSLYLVCEGDDELVLVDQHAAHERVAYERLRTAAEAGAVPRQQLLFPEPLDLSAAQAAVIEEHAAALADLGFEIEPVGPSRFAVRAIPAALDGADARRLAVELIDEVCALDEGGFGLAARDARARVLSRCACHAVVRAGDRVGVEEARALLAALDAVDFGAACPHGRPVYHRIRRGELERLFHRA